MAQNFSPFSRRSIHLAVAAALAVGALMVNVDGSGELAWASAHAQEALRPEVGKPLQAARDLIKAGKYKEALNKLRDVDAVANRSAQENFLLDQMRGSAASQSGDYDLAIKSFSAVVNSGKLNEADQGRYAGSLANLYYRTKDYKSAATWAEKALKTAPNDGAMRTMLIQSYFLGGDFPAASREAVADIQNAEKAGQIPSEDKLQLLANVASRQGGDRANYVAALEKLVAYYPKREYWLDLLRRIEAKPGYSGRLALDLFRLRQATKTLTESNDVVEMAQLALQAGQASEAKKLIDDAFASGLLGKGPEAERQRRLQTLANQKANEAPKELAEAEAEGASSKDGSQLLRTGLAYTAMGQIDKGLALMQKGATKGGFKYPDDAHLQLGLAYVRAGNKAKAAQEFKLVTGNDGASDIARLWQKVP